MEILVIHPGALGDIILSLPALRILGSQFESDRITLAANSEFAEAAASGYAGRFLSLSSLPLHRLFTSEPIPGGDLQFWRFYNRILSWTGSTDRSFAERLGRIHACCLIGSWKPGFTEKRHVSRIFADSLQPWVALPPRLPPTAIAIGPAARSQAVEWLRDQGLSGDRSLYVLHPGAGSATKRWPFSSFLDLARRLSTRGELLIVEGPAERGLGCELATAVGHRARVAAQLPLTLLAAVMSMSIAFVGNDSGIAHLAAGLQIPSVVLFGPTLPEHWAPLGGHVSVIRDPGNCRACGQEPDANHSCLQNISVDAVWQRVSPG